MCECVEYNDGSYYLCPVDADIYKRDRALLVRAVQFIEAFLQTNRRRDIEGIDDLVEEALQIWRDSGE